MRQTTAAQATTARHSTAPLTTDPQTTEAVLHPLENASAGGQPIDDEAEEGLSTLEIAGIAGGGVGVVVVGVWICQMMSPKPPSYPYHRV